MILVQWLIIAVIVLGGLALLLIPADRPVRCGHCHHPSTQHWHQSGTCDTCDCLFFEHPLEHRV